VRRLPVHEAGAFRALKQVDQALSRFEPLRMKSFHAAEKKRSAGRFPFKTGIRCMMNE